MANIITLKIDVKKLDKSRFFQGKEDKDGHTPLYADLVLIPRKEVGRFGDTHMVKQSKKKDEKVELPIIGSATEKEAFQSKQQPPPPAQSSAGFGGNIDEDVPFGPCLY